MLKSTGNISNITNVKLLALLNIKGENEKFCSIHFTLPIENLGLNFILNFPTYTYNLNYETTFIFTPQAHNILKFIYFYNIICFREKQVCVEFVQSRRYKYFDNIIYRRIFIVGYSRRNLFLHYLVSNNPFIPEWIESTSKLIYKNVPY